MKVEPVSTPYFFYDGRGPSLIRWLYHSDLFFPGTFWPHASDDIHGAEYGIVNVAPQQPGPWTSVQVVDPMSLDRAWVVFEGLQVIQIVPEEVHTYWHVDLWSGEQKRTGAWEVFESTWLKGFDQRHLKTSRHFILEFYDELVEIIADDLIFGGGSFNIDVVTEYDRRFAFAFFRRAQHKEKAGDLVAAIEDYRKYAGLSLKESGATFARKHADRLEAKL